MDYRARQYIGFDIYASSLPGTVRFSGYCSSTHVHFQSFINLYIYQAEDGSELDLKTGQIVQEHPSGQNQDGWAFVQNKDKAVGFVPIGYLEVYKDAASKIMEDLQPKVPLMTSPVAALNKTLQRQVK